MVTKDTFIAGNRIGKTSLCFAETLHAMGVSEEEFKKMMDIWYGRSDDDQDGLEGND